MSQLNLNLSQQVKVAQMCQQLIGTRLDVRQDKGYVTGVVAEISPSHWGDRRLVFRVVLHCGASGTPRTFHLSTFNSAR